MTRTKKCKDGKCSWCGEQIPVGDKYIWWPSVDDDCRLNGSCSMHYECDTALRQSLRDTFPRFVWVRGRTYMKPEYLKEYGL